MNPLSTIPGGWGRLLGVTPLDLAGYLRTNGWIQTAFDEVRAYWTAKKFHDEFEVLLPASTEFKDYGTRIYETLSTLSTYEQRPWTAVLNDVENFSADVVRIRINGPDNVQGNIALEAGAKLFEQTRELFLAAACSALEPKAVHPNHKPGAATDYLRKVRLGQTEVGSFVVQVISRVPPEIIEGENNFFPELIPTPYERNVTETLAKSLTALEQAATINTSTGAMRSTVDQGVSANLCEALSGMQYEDQRVGIQMKWAPARQLRTARRSEFSFGPSSLSYVGEIGRVFRANASAEGHELEGFVVRLSKRVNAKRGTIGVRAKIQEKYRVVSVTLEQNEYKLATQAHTERSPIFCIGDLVRDTHEFRLKYPRNFRVQPSEEKH